MEDRLLKVGTFEIILSNGKMTIRQSPNDIFIGAKDGERFDLLKEAIESMEE